MAMMVSPEVAKLFQVLTGEEWPDANEDHLRVLAMEWATAAQALGSQLAPGLRAAVAAIRQNFAGEAERAFAARVSPFIEGDNYIDAAAQLFKKLSDYLQELAADVEYMKLVSIYSLIALIAEIAWAIAMSPWTGGASMAWLAARMAIVRFLLRSLLGKVLLQLVQAAVFSIAFQLLIDVAAQATQFAMGTRDKWNTKHTANAAGVGAMGAALTPFMAGLGKLVAGGLTKFLDNFLANKFGKNWTRDLPEVLTQIGTEAFHETLTEALYKYATEGEFEMNPYAATSGAASGTGNAIGEAIGNFAFGDPGAGGGAGPGGGNDDTTRSGPGPNGDSPTDTTGSGGGPNGGPPGGGPPPGGPPPSGPPPDGSRGPSDNLGGNNSTTPSTQPPPVGGSNGQPPPVSVGSGGQSSGSGGGPEQNQPTNGQEPSNGGTDQPGGQQPPTNAGPDRSGGQPPSGNGQQPPTNVGTNQPGGQQPPANGQQPPNGGTGQPGGQQPPTNGGTDQPNGQQSPNNGEQPPTNTGTDQPNTQQPPTNDQQPPANGTDQPPTNTGAEQPSNGQQPPSDGGIEQPPANVGTDQPTNGQQPSTDVGTDQPQPPASGTDQPSNGQQPPAIVGNDQPADEQPPTNIGTDQPNNGQQPPTNTGNDQPANEQPPRNIGTDQPNNGQQQSDNGQQPPGNVGTEQPTNGQQPPANNGTGQPSNGQQPPSNVGTEQPTDGQQPPANGQRPPSNVGTEQPTNGQQPPTDVGNDQSQQPPTNVGTDQPNNGQPPPTNLGPNQPSNGQQPPVDQPTNGQLPTDQSQQPPTNVGTDQRGQQPPTTNGTGQANNGQTPPINQPSDGQSSAANVGTDQPHNGQQPPTDQPKNGQPSNVGVGTLQQPPSNGQQSPNSGQAQVGKSAPVNQPIGQQGSLPSSTPGNQSGGGRPSSSFVVGGRELPPTKPKVEGKAAGKLPAVGVPKTSAPKLRTPLSSREAAATLSLGEPSTSAESHALTDNPVHTHPPDNRRGNGDQNNRDQANNHQNNRDQSNDNDGNRDQNNRDNGNNRNPYQAQVDAANQAAEAAATARDNAAVAWAAARNAHRQAQLHLIAAQRSALDALGAVIGTEGALARANQRATDAQQHLTNVTDLRNTLATEYQQAAANLETAQDNNNDAGIRRWGPRTNILETRLAAANRAVDTATRAFDTAQQDQTATQVSADAARTAHTAAQDAVNRAQQAVVTADAATQQAATDRDTTNTAAAAANAILQGQTNANPQDSANGNPQNQPNTNLQDQANAVNNLRTAAEDLATQAETADDTVTDLTNQRNDLTAELVVMEPDNPGRQALIDRRDALDTRIAEATTAAADLNTQATQAAQTHDTAVRNLDTAVDQVNTHRDTAQTAATDATTQRDTATQAATTAETAKDDAKTAAAQGEVERGLTQISSLPPNSQLTIETLGNLDGLVDLLTDLTGQDRATIAPQLTPDAIATAVNTGRITIGDVDVSIDADLHRPADTRNTPQHQQPAAVKTDTSGESSNPLSESTSSSMPIRIPLLFISPVDMAGGAVRPMVYVGGVVKRSQKFDSATTISSSTGTEKANHVPTTMSITASVPGRTGTATVDTGLRLPSITPGRPMQGPMPPVAFTNLTAAPATVPPAFTGVLGQDATGLDNQLLTNNQNPLQVDVGGTQVTITPTAAPSLTYVGTTGVDHTHGTSHSNSSSTTRGSDATFGTGVYGGQKGWFIGAFTDFSTGLTDGTNPANEHSSSHTSSDTELVYRVDRPMSVQNGDTTVQDTVSSTVQVPVPVARSLGLPLPPHLAGTQPVPVDTTQQPTYHFGKDNITDVKTDQITTFLNEDLSAKGTAAVNATFDTPGKSRDAVYNAMHGGQQVVWTEGGRTHVLDIHARPAPPTTTAPSGQTSSSAEDKNADQFRRNLDSKRTVRIGLGGAYMPTGTDTPGNSAPRTTPADGNPNPYQGGPTTSGGAPRAAITGTVETGYGNKSGYTGKDGRASKYDGDMRDYTGSLDFVVVHRSTRTPNWAQRFFLGDRMLFGPDATSRTTEPTRAEIDQAFTNNQPSQHIRTGQVADAIEVSTPSDKLPWATKPLPRSQMTPGVYLGNPPDRPADVVPVSRRSLGDYTNVEHVRVTPNTTEGVYIALAKRVEPTGAAPENGGPNTRVPPKGSGNWPTWSQRTITDTRQTPAGPQTTTYTYKNSEMTRPGTTSGDAVRDFVGRVGSRGTASQGIGGQQNATGKMIQPGRLQDFNGDLKATSEYSSPRVVDVRPEGTLKRNHAGDSVAGSTKSYGLGLDGEISLGVAPKRESGTGALLRGVFGGGWKKGGSHAVDLTSGGKQTFEYKGPTAFVALDVRYTYAADMNLRNVFRTSGFDDVTVTVDQPDGVLVEMPVAHAIDLFTMANLPVPPELTGALPEQADTVTDPAQTLLTPNGEYASHSDTSVIRANLDDRDGALAQVGEQLTDLGVDSGKWRDQVLDQVDKLLNTPTGHVWLKDVLVGEQGFGGLISVPNSGVAYEDVVDIRVTATPAIRPAPRPDMRPIVPGKQSNADYLSSSVQDKKSSTWNVAGALEVGVNHREVPTVPPGQPDANGVVQQAPPNPGASSGTLTPQVFGGSKSWKTDEVLPTSVSDKVNTQVDTDKVGRTSHQVDYHLDISRRRSPMPAIDAPLLGVPKHINRDKLSSEPVVLEGSVDLVSPSQQASPPLTKPANPPTFEVLRSRPDRTPMFGPSDGWRLEAAGTDTVAAVHDGMYSQLGDRQLPFGPATPEQVRDSASHRSEYTRPGSNSEYVLHSRTTGSALRNGSNAIFTGDGYHVENTIGRKHTLYDSLFDMTVTADFHQDSFRFVAALPDDTTMNLSQDQETGRPEGKSSTVTTSYGPSLPWSAGNTYGSGGPGPTTVSSGPPANTTISQDVTTAESSKTGSTGGVKHSGRSYVFLANADIYTEANRHGSNWTQGALTTVWDGVRGHQHHADSVMRIGSRDDLHVRVWENTALDKGLLTIADVWSHNGKTPGDGLTITRTGDGATLTRTGDDAPAVIAPPDGSPRGRNLQVGPGVTPAQVKDFVATLPKDMRPTTFTVDPHAQYTPTDIQNEVADLPEPPAADTTAETTVTDPNEVTAPAESRDTAELSSEPSSKTEPTDPNRPVNLPESRRGPVESSLGSEPLGTTPAKPSRETNVVEPSPETVQVEPNTQNNAVKPGAESKPADASLESPVVEPHIETVEPGPETKPAGSSLETPSAETNAEAVERSPEAKPVDSNRDTSLVESSPETPLVEPGPEVRSAGSSRDTNRDTVEVEPSPEATSIESEIEPEGSNPKNNPPESTEAPAVETVVPPQPPPTDSLGGRRKQNTGEGSSTQLPPRGTGPIRTHQQTAAWFSDALRKAGLTPFLSGGAALGFQQGSRPINDLDFRVTMSDAQFRTFGENNGRDLLTYLNEVVVKDLQREYRSQRANDPSVPSGGVVEPFFGLGGIDGSRTIGSPNVLGHEVSVSIVSGDVPDTISVDLDGSGRHVDLLAPDDLRADKLRTMISRTKTGDESVKKVAQDLFDFLDSMDLIDSRTEQADLTGNTADHVDQSVRDRFAQYRDGNLDGTQLHHLSESDLFDLMQARAVLTARAHVQPGARRDAIDAMLHDVALRHGPDQALRLTHRLEALAALPVAPHSVSELRPWMKSWNNPDTFGPPPESRSRGRQQWRDGADADTLPATVADTVPPPPAVQDLMNIHADDIVANVRATVPQSTPHVEQVVRVLAFSGGFRDLLDSTDHQQTITAFGLTKPQFGRAFTTLRNAGLVKDSPAGLSLTKDGWRMIPTSGPQRVIGLDGQPIPPPSPDRPATPVEITDLATDARNNLATEPDHVRRGLGDRARRILDENGWRSSFPSRSYRQAIAIIADTLLDGGEGQDVHDMARMLADRWHDVIRNAGRPAAATTNPQPPTDSLGARKKPQSSNGEGSSRSVPPVNNRPIRTHEQTAAWFSDALRKAGLTPFLSGGAALGFQQGTRSINDLDFRITMSDAEFRTFGENNGRDLLTYLNEVVVKDLQREYRSQRANDPSVPSGGVVEPFFGLGGIDGSRTIGSPNVLGHEVSVSVVSGDKPATISVDLDGSGRQVDLLVPDDLRADKLRTMISRTKTGDESVKKVAQDLFDFLDAMDLIDGRTEPGPLKEQTADHVDQAVRDRFAQYRDGNLDGSQLHHLSESDLFDLMQARAVLTARAHVQHGARRDALNTMFQDAALRGGPDVALRLTHRLEALASLPVAPHSATELRPWMRSWNDPESFGPPPESRSRGRQQWRDGAEAGTLPSDVDTVAPPPAVRDLMNIHADDIVANVRSTLPRSTSDIEQVVRVLAFSGGFRDLLDSTDSQQTIEAFGLTKPQFGRAFTALRDAGLVAASDAGLSLTKNGWRLIPTSGPQRVYGLDGQPIPPPSPDRPSTPVEITDMANDARTSLASEPDHVRRGLANRADRILRENGWRSSFPSSSYRQAVAIISDELRYGDDPDVHEMARTLADRWHDVLRQAGRPTQGNTDAIAGPTAAESTPHSSPPLGAEVAASGGPRHSAPEESGGAPKRPPADHEPSSSLGKRSRDEFEADEGPVTVPEPPSSRPMPERLVPPAPEDTAALLAAVPPGTRFADPATFVELINGPRSAEGRDVNCVDAALAFHATYHGDPRVAGSALNGAPRSAGTAAGEELGYAPEMFSRGEAGLAEIVERVRKGGHGSDAVVFGFPRQGQGHAWNIVNHDGVVSIVDAQDGVVLPPTDNPVPGLDRIYAIPLDADGNFITDDPAPPTPPADADPYEVAEYEHAVQVHDMRAAAAAGQEIPLPEGGRLVPSLGGLRLVGATVAAEYAAALAGLTGRDVIALVIGADAEYPEYLKFTPGGRPLPV